MYLLAMYIIFNFSKIC